MLVTVTTVEGNLIGDEERQGERSGGLKPSLGK